MNNLYKQKLSAPYKIENGKKKTVFNIRFKAGVYMIFKRSKIVYIGFSGSDVYKALYRHFESWNDKTQIRITYDPNKVKVRLIYCRTYIQADRLEKALILKYKPKDNPNKYIQFEADDKEKEILTEFIDTDTQPVAEFNQDLPF